MVVQNSSYWNGTRIVIDSGAVDGGFGADVVACPGGSPRK
jgi:hypothetical protein